MGDVGLEFEALRRLRTPETPPKRAPVAPRWGCDGGNAPDANTSCRRLARCANGWQRTSPQPGTPLRHACTQHKVCMAAGAGALG